MILSKDELAHFGILGMKWGRRKAHASVSSLSSNSAKAKTEEPDDSSDDHKKITALRKKKPSQLSNAEMQAVITRANLERQFSELSKQQTKNGHKIVQDVLFSAGKEVATNYVKEWMKSGAETYLPKPGKK